MARDAINLAIHEENKRADARVTGAGRSYGVEARLRGEIPQTGDDKAAKND